MIGGYEAHITLELDSNAHEDTIELLEQLGGNYVWFCSRITNDPVLGEGSKFYYTKNKEEFEELATALSTFLRQLKDKIPANTKVVRAKIEKIVMDIRF